MVQKDVSRGPETETQLGVTSLSETEILLYKNIVDVTSNQASSLTVKNCVMAISLASHTLRREEGSGHAATFELLPRNAIIEDSGRK